MAEEPKKISPEVAQQLKVLNKTISELGNNSDKVIAGIVKGFKKAAKGSADYSGTLDKVNDKMSSYLNNTSSSLDKLDKSVLGVIKSMKNINMSKYMDPKTVRTMTGELGVLYKKIGKIRKQKGPLNLEAMQKQNGAIQGIEKEIGAVQALLEATSMTSKDAMNSISGGMGQFVGSFKALKGSSKDMAAQGKSAGVFADKMKLSGGALSKMPGLVGKMGSAMKIMGGALGGISKMLTGWPGLILGGIKMLANAYLAADDFIKNANKAFASMRGPDIMTGDVAKQFKEFNNAIYDITDNLRDGVDVDQIRGLLEGISQAGLQITTLNKGLGNYRDAIHIAAKASRSLGMELPRIGSMVGDLMTEFRMDLDKVDGLFTQVAFDANKAGLSTESFWGAIQNASSSMAMYGVFIKSASKTMKTFSEAQIGGAKDSAEATADMYQRFKEGSLETNAALLQFANKNGIKLKKEFKAVADNFKAQAGEVAADVQQLRDRRDNTDDPKEKESLDQEIVKLQNKQYSLQEKSDRALHLSTKNAVASASDMGLLANKAPEILSAVLKKLGGVSNLSKIQGDTMNRVLKSVDKFGISEKTVRMLVSHSRQTSIKIGELLGYGKDGKAAEGSLIDSLNTIADLSDDQLKKLKAGEVSSIKMATINKKFNGDEKNTAKENKKLQDEAIKESQAISANLVNLLGVDKSAADMAVQAAQADATAAANLDAVLKSSEEVAKATLAAQADGATDKDEKALKLAREQLKVNTATFNKTMKNDKLTQKITENSFKSQRETADEIGKKAEDNMKAMIGQTLSARDMIKIAKEGTKWNLAMLSGMTKITGFVSGIASEYLGSDYESPEEKENRKTLKSFGKDYKKGSKQATNDLLSELEKQGQLRKDIEATKDKSKKVEEGDFDGLTIEALGKESKKDPALKAAMDVANAKAGKGKEATKEDVVKEWKDILKKQQKKQEDELKYSEKMTTYLEGMSSSNEKIAGILRQQLMQDPKTFENFAQSIEGQSLTDEEIETKFKEKTGASLNADTIKEQVRRGGGSGGWKSFGKSKIYSADTLAKGGGGGYVRKKRNKEIIDARRGETKEADPPLQKAGLRSPLEIIKSGLIKLHEGEMILPMSNMANAGVPDAGGGAAAGASSQKTINITVNANEKDLAQRIANGVRGVLYNEQLTGAG